MERSPDIIELVELSPDDRNANRGTQRGGDMLAHSLRTYGAGRSVLLDKYGRVVAGNKTLEQATLAGLREAIIVESDGTRLVAVKRTDIDLDSTAGRELAIADNRTSEVGLQWDIETLRDLQREGVELTSFWNQAELDSLLRDTEPTPPDDFKEYDEDIPAQNCCPSCGYWW